MNRLVYWAALFAAISHGACNFDRSGIAASGSEIDANTSLLDAQVSPDGTVIAFDAAIDAGSLCTPGELYCAGRTRARCNPDGTGPVAGSETVCDFTCADTECVLASNIQPDDANTCANSNPPRLTPGQGTTLRILPNALGGVTITCAPDCGTQGQTSISSIGFGTGATEPSALFCLSELDIPANVSLEYVGAVEHGLIFLVNGTAQIRGKIDMSGGNASNVLYGEGGPGGGRGGMFRTLAAGEAGQGGCGGSGGPQQASGNNTAAGGGGGGAFGGNGGDGGTGSSPNGNVTALGGVKGTSCGNPTLVPLRGGSGGGSGAAGECAAGCGWAGGGGGGAIQIAARRQIVVTATGIIDASGGNGHGSITGTDGRGGGGGGGSGGAILLESPTVTLDGQLLVEGGRGGQSGSGMGGAGAAGNQLAGSNGPNENVDGEGGAGGGGGGGRVRINTYPDEIDCNNDANVSPAGACSRGQLAIAP